MVYICSILKMIEEEEEEIITYELKCLICKRLVPITFMVFFPFMKGGVCKECRYPTKKEEEEKKKDDRC